MTLTLEPWQALAGRRIDFAEGCPIVDGLIHDELTTVTGEPYMERFYLGRGQAGDVRFHHILASDVDRDLHDHPWDYLTLLLSGRYIEVTSTGEAEYRAPAMLVRKATDAHRLVLPDGPVWTLFVTGGWQREWGFHTPDGWVSWRTYRGQSAPRSAVGSSRAW